VKLNSIVIGAAILGAVALSVHSQNAAAKPALAAKVAVVGMRDAMLNTQDGKQAMAVMQTKFEPMRIGLEKRQAELQTMAEQLRKGAATMAAEAQQKLSNELAAKKKSFDRDADDLNTEVEQEDGKLMQDLTGKMGGVIDEYAKQNGYTVVMDAAQPVLWAAETANITSDIVKLYDSKHPAAKPAAPAGKK
jgi:outer membrane protein